MNPNASTLVPLILVTVLVGAAVPIQSGANARLGRELGGPIAAALVSFTIGLVSLLIAMLVTRTPFALGTAVKNAPAWAWVGGLIGAAFVTTAAVAGPRLGFGFYTGLVIAGQLAVSLVLDHFGLLGAERQPVTAARIIGILLVVVGVWLVRRSP